MCFVEKRLQVAGAEVAHREQGAGPPLLFLHGAGGTAGALPWLARFAHTHRVLAPDHPGFGASSEAEWLDNIHDLAYYYLEYLQALDLHNVHLVGTSLGGWLALEIAVRDSTRLHALSVIGASGIRPGDVPTGDLFMWSPEDRVRNLVADRALAERILGLPQTPEQQHIALRNHFATAKLAWEPRFFDPHLEKWLHRIRIPTHVIWGEQDRLFPVEYGRKLASCVPGAMFSVIPACGHLPHVEAPDALQQLVEVTPTLSPALGLPPTARTAQTH
jgi:pimeloyl-ACP methyl ester carboxylesterase